MSSRIVRCTVLDGRRAPFWQANVPNVDKEEDRGPEMRESSHTLHLNRVHLFQWVVEAGRVSIQSKYWQDGLLSALARQCVFEGILTYIPGVSIT